ncbi:unannotated protein [freshwater metagenome]|uniref:Unannotated protein n=1 Tax=freshwater metagenome TaxID=449393 RepID=A0A6J6B4W2_9ZZZZ
MTIAYLRVPVMLVWISDSGKSRIGATNAATRAGSVIWVWSTTMLMAETLRANEIPLTSVMSPRGAGITRVDCISFAALA